VDLCLVSLSLGDACSQHTGSAAHSPGLSGKHKGKVGFGEEKQGDRPENHWKNI